LLEPPSTEVAGGGARTADKRVSADLKAGSICQLYHQDPLTLRTKPADMMNSTAAESGTGYSLLLDSSLVLFFVYVWFCIVLFGLTSNTINIVVFARMGLKDNVTITLLFLSVSDLIHLALYCPSMVARYILTEKTTHVWPFDPYILLASTKIYCYLFYDYSSFVSVFLAVVRCLCVAKPLAFKSMITKARTLFCLVAIFLITVIMRVPMFTVFRMTTVIRPSTNASFTKLFLSSDYFKVHQVNDILNKNILSWLAYSTVVVCVIILLYKLREAAKFRRSLATSIPEQSKGASEGSNEKSSELSDPDMATLDTMNKTQVSESTTSKSKNMISQKMSAKDLQVAQSVTLICIIFIFSQLPFQVAAIYRLVEPEFDNNRRYDALYKLSTFITNTCGLLNASINIFVYVTYNSKFRENFLPMIFTKTK
ncbi:chemosensory receptor c, partial [Plakobranchus ocellatus]